MDQSLTEENYLKAIYSLSKTQPKGVSTKSIGLSLEIKPPTVSDMLKKLSDKKLIQYALYKGVLPTLMGEKIALKVIRKHRLWETFLVEHFNFKWDEVHDIAEQLEHIKSPDLVQRLDEYLDFPEHDPHGDPIPDKDGNIKIRHKRTLDQVTENERVIMVGVKDHTSKFLKYLDSIEVKLGSEILVHQIIEYDKSFLVEIREEKKKTKRSLSFLVCKNILVS
jgi:DtxR family Mn-dependent transcriptional regulator